MARLSHRLEYLLTRIGMGLVRWLSPRAADRFGVCVGMILWAVLPSRRMVARDNLRLALGDDPTGDNYATLVRRVFQNIGRSFVEFARIRMMSREEIRPLVIGAGAELFAQAQARGRGAVLLTAHFGNWELLGFWAALETDSVDFLTGRLHNPLIDRLMQECRQQMRVGIIPLTTNARTVLRRLRENRLIAMVADQHAPNGVLVDFFGHPAATPKGPAMFAIHAGCPILPYLLRRERWDRHVVIVGPPIYPPDSGDREADMRMMTERYTKFFEQEIRKYPDQWMWTHRRWKNLNSHATA